MRLRDLLTAISVQHRGILPVLALRAPGDDTGPPIDQELSIPVYGLVAGAGVGGSAIALAARPTLENFIGALNLFADRPVRVGD